jgi:hypothetical protein
MVNHNASICYRAVCGDAPNLFVREEEDSVGRLGDTFFALGKSMDFLAHCWYPEVFEVRVMLSLFILSDGLLGHKMSNTKTVFFNINVWPSPL